MSLAAFYYPSSLILREAQGSERGALINFDMVAYNGCFTYDNAGAVVDKEVSAYFCSGMYVNTGFCVRTFGHYSWN